MDGMGSVGNGNTYSHLVGVNASISWLHPSGCVAQPFHSDLRENSAIKCIPIGSMYGIFTYIWLFFFAIVEKVYHK